MKFVVEVVYPNIFRKFALMTHVEEFPHAVDAIRYIRARQKLYADHPRLQIDSYKITLVKE
jgi:hypothetical protein